jgi:hypothetical protein
LHYWFLVLSLVGSPYRPASTSVLPTALPQPNIISFNNLPHSSSCPSQLQMRFI